MSADMSMVVRMGAACVGTLLIMAATPPSWIAVFAIVEWWALVFVLEAPS